MIETSCNSKINTQLSIKKGAVVISNLPFSRSFDEIMLFIVDDNGNEYGKMYIKRQANIYFDLSQLKAGMYYFQLYRKLPNENQYWSYLYDQNIPIHIHYDRTIKFKISPVYKHNADIFNTFRTDKTFLLDCLKPSNESQSNDLEIIKLSDLITKNSNSEYIKIRQIHDWIATNIYYDMDAFYDKSHRNIDTSALGTLSSKRSVCQGYSDLSVALLRAVGIPAMGLSCYALGISTVKKWTTQILNSTETNHRITMAFVKNRWLLLDITWDSDNVYKNGVFENKSGLGHTYKYFDVTIPFLSFSHRLSL